MERHSTKVTSLCAPKSKHPITGKGRGRFRTPSPPSTFLRPHSVRPPGQSAHLHHACAAAPARQRARGLGQRNPALNCGRKAWLCADWRCRYGRSRLFGTRGYDYADMQQGTQEHGNVNGAGSPGHALPPPNARPRADFQGTRTARTDSTEVCSAQRATATAGPSRHHRAASAYG